MRKHWWRMIALGLVVGWIFGAAVPKGWIALLVAVVILISFNFLLKLYERRLAQKRAKKVEKPAEPVTPAD